MKYIGVTMRADKHPHYHETRDAIDQRWFKFLSQCGLIPFLIPNSPQLLEQYLSKIKFSGFLLTGGNSPLEYEGDSAERDEIDQIIINFGLNNELPIVGVCRGMQSIQLAFDHKLQKVEAHVQPQQTITANHEKIAVNSYHTLGTLTCNPPLECWAKSDDGVVKAIKHQQHTLWGIMWHPERLSPFRDQDLQFFQQVFSSK